MGLFGFGSKKKNSKNVAKDRLKLVLVYDRAGTGSNNEMIEMMKKDIMAVISKYIEIDAQELDIKIRNTTNEDFGSSSELSVNIPIKQVKKIGKNRY